MSVVEASPVANGTFNPLNYLYKPGLPAITQVANGSTLVSGVLGLRGSTQADLGSISILSPVTIDVDIGVAGILRQQPLAWTTSMTLGATNGGMITDSGTITYTNAFFIWALLAELRRYQAAVNPGFAAFTLFNALPTIANSGNFNLVQALVLNVGVTHERNTSGISTTVQTTGVSFSAQAKATVSGAIMTFTTGMTGLRFSPTFSTVAGSTVNMGTLVAVDCLQPAQALFQPSAGVENMTAYYGIRVPNMTFGGSNRIIDVINSALNAATNVRMINHTGTALSRLRGDLQFDVDLVGTTYGASLDAKIAWAGVTNSLFFQFLTGFLDQLHFSNPSDGRILIQGGAASAGVDEININVSRFSLGAQAGAVGNQVGVFVAPARNATISGGWSDFLLTQAGNITVNTGVALSQLAGWTINAPSITLAGTGSVVDAMGLLIGGNPNQGTNRYGLLVLSNPVGGTLNYCARFQGAAGVRIDGILEHGAANLGFYGTAPIAQQVAVPVTIAAVHAALVALGLIT